MGILLACLSAVCTDKQLSRRKAFLPHHVSLALGNAHLYTATR